MPPTPHNRTVRALALADWFIAARSDAFDESVRVVRPMRRARFGKRDSHYSFFATCAA